MATNLKDRVPWLIAYFDLSVLESAHPLQTCPEPELPVDTYTYQLVGTVQTGTYAYLTCEQDYELTSAGHKKVYCGKNGRWNRGKDELASCKGLYHIPYRTKLFIGINVSEIRDCQKSRKGKPTLT